MEKFITIITDRLNYYVANSHYIFFLFLFLWCYDKNRTGVKREILNLILFMMTMVIEADRSKCFKTSFFSRIFDVNNDILSFPCEIISHVGYKS